MKLRIVMKPDWMCTERTVYSVQKKYWFFPFWIEHGWYNEEETSREVAEVLLNPVIWIGRKV